jgi:hypothetical protein
MVIFVLQVCFIYKTFLEKSQAPQVGFEPTANRLEGGYSSPLSYWGKILQVCASLRGIGGAGLTIKEFGPPLPMRVL